jgi:RNase adaptor protein for sRNA GlmZ degradation
MRVVIVSGLSGSGKSVALHMLEDLGFYCIDNIPAALLKQFISHSVRSTERLYQRIAVGLDARNTAAEIATVPALADELKRSGIQCELLFLVSGDEEILRRFAETRRRHPMSGVDVDLRVQQFLEAQPGVRRMLDDITGFLAARIPEHAASARQYLTVAIGCTGGQHRSVYFVDRLAEHFGAQYPQVTYRHSALPDAALFDAPGTGQAPATARQG